MLRIEIPQLIDLGKATCQRRKSLKFTAVGTYRFNFSLTNRVTIECSRNLVVPVITEDSRPIASTELTNHSESEHSSVTPAALLWKIAAEAIQIVLLYTPATNEHLPPRQTREAVIKIINWKNLDVHYGFLVIPPTIVTGEYQKSYVVINSFSQFQ